MKVLYLFNEIEIPLVKSLWEKDFLNTEKYISLFFKQIIK